MVKNPPANAGIIRHRFDPWVGKISWKSVWQPTSVFLSGDSHGQRSLASYSPSFKIFQKFIFFCLYVCLHLFWFIIWFTVCCSSCCCLVAMSYLTLFVTQWTVAWQVPLSMGFPRQEYWNHLPFPSPGDFPDPGIEHVSCIGRGFFTSEPPGTLLYYLSHIFT